MPKRRKSIKIIPEGYSYYDSIFGPILRKKGGPSAARIKKDPAYKSLRERNAEFDNVAKSATLFRNAVTPLLARKDHGLVGHVNSLFLKIKELDMKSSRGKRQVSIGLQNPEAKKLVTYFEINPKSQLNKVFNGKMRYENTRELTLELDLYSDLVTPKNATHVLFIARWIRLDFTKKEEVIREDSFQTLIEKKQVIFSLQAKKALPAGGAKFLLLSIQFIQEQNGRQYPMMQSKYRPVTILQLF